jgi:erythromycin esterase
MGAFGYEGTLAIRDQAMAENVKWLVGENYPGQKIILWAHNGHVGYHNFPFANRKTFNGRSTYDMVGTHLKQMLALLHK